MIIVRKKFLRKNKRKKNDEMFVYYVAFAVWTLITLLAGALECTASYSLRIDRIRPSLILAWDVLGIILLIMVIIKM